MKSLTSISLAALMAVTLLNITGCGGGQEEKTKIETDQASAKSQEQLTAREAFAIADKAAKDWASDAVPVDISTYPSPPKSSGHGSCWKFEFNSSALEKELEVYVRRGKLFQTMEGTLVAHDAISDRWIDSPEAITVALKRCSQTSNEKYWFGLSAAEGIPSWYIKCYKTGEEPTWVKINALSGEEEKTWTGQ